MKSPRNGLGTAPRLSGSDFDYRVERSVPIPNLLGGARVRYPLAIHDELIFVASGRQRDSGFPVPTIGPFHRCGIRSPAVEIAANADLFRAEVNQREFHFNFPGRCSRRACFIRWCFGWRRRCRPVRPNSRQRREQVRGYRLRRRAGDRQRRCGFRDDRSGHGSPVWVSGKASGRKVDFGLGRRHICDQPFLWAFSKVLSHMSWLCSRLLFWDDLMLRVRPQRSSQKRGAVEYFGASLMFTVPHEVDRKGHECRAPAEALPWSHWERRGPRRWCGSTALDSQRGFDPDCRHL